MDGKVTFQTSNGSENLNENMIKKINKSLKNFWTTFNQTETIYQEFQVTMKNGSLTLQLISCIQTYLKVLIEGLRTVGTPRNIWLEIAYQGTIGHWKTAQKK
jgi:hypothetical protein